METKRDLEDKAKKLTESNPEESVKIYKLIYDTFQQDLNKYDAFFTLKALRNCKNPDLSWARDLVTKYKDEKVSNIYGWLIYDHCVKGKDRRAILGFEKFITELPEHSPQKNIREDNSYPCPTTVSIFKLLDACNENLFNPNKTLALLSKLDYGLLSDKPKSVESEKKGEIEYASDFEKYLGLKTKALFKLGKYQECRNLCDIALNSLDKFHYNNDLWFRMRIALCEDKLGNYEESEKLLKELVSSKTGKDKWFFYRDIAEVYYENKEYSKAWKYAIDAAYYGNEPHYLIGLYLLQARILFKLNRPKDGKVLAELISAILKEHGWGDKSEYIRLFDYYKVDREHQKPLHEILKTAREFWNTERYGSKAKVEGVIITVHQNGKIGRIKCSNGKLLDFHKKDLIKKEKNLDRLLKSEVSFYVMKLESGKEYAESISIISKTKPAPSKDLVGKVVEGTIVGTVNFGIFIQLPDKTDGLLHRNSLPKSLKDDFREKFRIGEKINVYVEKATDKGLELKING